MLAGAACVGPPDVIARRPARSRSGTAAAEQAVAAGADQASGHDQHDAEDDLTLDQLHDADHDQDGGDQPKQGCTHLILSLLRAATVPLGWPTRTPVRR